MKELLEKISSYNLFNFLLPGILYVYVVAYLTSFNLVADNLILGVFFYYFIGLIISRIGSLIVDFILRKTKFIKKKSKEEYQHYKDAKQQDSDIKLFVEVSNMYRTIIALLFLILITIGIDWIVGNFQIPIQYLVITVIVLLLILFLFAYKKQRGYVEKSVEFFKNK